MLLVAAIISLAFPALVLAAAARDALSFTIPNWISLALVAIFPVAALAVGLPWRELGLHAGIGALVLVAGMAAFAFRWIGGGDAKLMAAVALWLGWPALTTFLAGAAICGGVLAMILLTLRSAALRPYVLLGPAWVTRLAEPGEGVPYGVAIAAGALAAFPLTRFAAGLAL
ncbi:MAG: prepilin peptidase [Caulobacterales bacterium]|nr:prepilin peptidase [Caulobacterales bacterium]